MVNEKTKTECCGCRACEQICPTRAITMAEDDKGFFYPYIDSLRCNQCGLCDLVCGFREDYPNHGDEPMIYAAKHKDDTIRQTSTSGGMFTAISDEILKRSGVIYGVGMDASLSVCHMRAETPGERDRFKGSKYVQSNIGETFVQARKDLDSGRYVLYSGTPCQISSLLLFLRKKYDNLITVDLVCKGTPSNKMWHEYLNVMRQKSRGEIVGVEFRNKDKGWHRPITKLITRDGKWRISGEQSFFQLFNSNIFLMPSCHGCKFTNFARPADISIADFWGIERTCPEFDDNWGVSLVLVNSPRGRELFKAIETNIVTLESQKENCLQSALQKPIKKNEKSDEFWEDYFKYGMKYAMIKYTDYSAIRTFMRKGKRKIGGILERLMNVRRGS